MNRLCPLTALLICLVCIQASAQPVSPKDSEHFKDVDKRGDKAMGFGHEMTSHHFLLFKDGGAIEVESVNPNDSDSKEAIRDHLVKVAGMFSRGDFELPMLIHATVPPGVETMKRLKNEIAAVSAFKTARSMGGIARLKTLGLSAVVPWGQMSER